KVAVGLGPNGLAYDPGRDRLVVAHVGDPQIPHSSTVSIVDVAAHAVIASVPVPGRTRWAVFDPQQEVFFVNISDPAQIIVLDARHPQQIARLYAIAATARHRLR